MWPVPGQGLVTERYWRPTRRRMAGRSGSRRYGPARAHDTTCARVHGLTVALNRLSDTLGVPTLADLGYENAGTGFRHPCVSAAGSCVQFWGHDQEFGASTIHEWYYTSPWEHCG